jgi:Flp pilus assembly protein TadD
VAHLKLLAQSLKGPKEAAAAAKGLEKLKKGSSDARLAVQIGNAWRRAGDGRKAADAYRGALLADPLRANLGLGRVELAGGEGQQAELSFRAALAAWDKGPFGVDDKTEARVGLARALLARKASDEAIAALTPSLAEDKLAPEPHYWLARAQQNKGNAEEALKEAQRATELDDEYADAFALLGDLAKPGDKERARRAYKRYLELAPAGDLAKSVKKSLASLK